MSAMGQARSETTVAGGLEPLLVPVGRLRQLAGNPRRGNVEAVAASLARFGQRKAIVARRDPGGDGGEVIAGNHTLQAALSLGWEQIAVVWVDDDEATAKAFALADNRTAELGGYDEPALASMIREVRDADEELFAASGWGDGDDLRDLLARLEPAPVQRSEPDEVPDSAPARTESGDVWLLGPHRLVCGDSTDTDVLGALGAGGAAMVWTDPPYGVAIGSKNELLNSKGKGRSDPAALAGDEGKVEAEPLWRASFAALRQVLAPGTPWYICGPQGPELGLLLLLLLREYDMGPRHQLVWVKHRGTFSLGRLDYEYAHEPVIYGWVPGAAHPWYRESPDTTTFEVDRPAASRLHPTMKPVALIAPMLENSSRPGDIVLDPFGGSGSTLIAAHDTGRVARLVELDPHYCDVICRRYQQHSGIVPILERTGEAVDFDAEST